MLPYGVIIIINNNNNNNASAVDVQNRKSATNYYYCCAAAATTTSLLHPFNGLFTSTTEVSRCQKGTRSSAIAEGPRDASCQLKSCQLSCNSAVRQVLNNRSYEVGGLRWADV